MIWSELRGIIRVLRVSKDLKDLITKKRAPITWSSSKKSGDDLLSHKHLQYQRPTIEEGGLNGKWEGEKFRLSRKSVWASFITCSYISRLYSTLIVHLYLINIFLLCPLSRKGPNARHTGAPVAHSSCS